MTGNETNQPQQKETLIERHYHERIRRVHLIMLCVMSVFYVGVASTAVSLDWETWMLPFIAAGVLFCWGLHIRQRYSERERLRAFFAVFWVMLVYHGVHASSFFDLASLAAIEFAILALTNELRLLNIGFALFWFCWLWSGHLVVLEPGFALTPVLAARVIGNVGVVVTSFIVARTIMRNRIALRDTDERVIAELSETKRRTEDFLVHVSHAFRTPVNVVAGMSSVLSVREEDPEKKKSLTHIAGAGSELGRKLDDLLDYTELETGRFVTENVPYRIDAVIGDVLSALGLYTKEIPLEVVVDVDTDLPKAIRGDVRHVRKMLYHILDNALKYTKRGGVYLHVYKEERPYGFNLCMEVWDSGTGMSAEALSGLREGFYRIEDKRHFSEEGFGLGLQIVHGIAHAMNGFVRMESGINRGTHVHVSIPQEIAEAGRCMEPEHADTLKPVFYLREDRFRIPVVRDYYNRMITNLIRSFAPAMKRVTSLADFKALMEADNTVTHVLVTENEYEEDSACFDALAKNRPVIVCGARSFAPQPGSDVTVLQKPLCTIPLAEVLNAETAQEAKARLRGYETVRFDGLRALVVDDEEMNLLVAKQILSEYGIRTELAHNGKEALFLAGSRLYDVIFMDHFMPGMDGVSCARRIRDVLLAEGRQVKVIALTAHATSVARSLFAQEGFDGFIAKPVERMELERELHRVFNDPESVPIPDAQPVRPAEDTGAKTKAKTKAKTETAPLVMPRNPETGKRRILVTADSAADLPEEWVRRYDIRLIPHVLHTDTGSFFDNREIDGDELMYYMRDEGHAAKSEVPDTETFRRFFTACLTEAEEVVHLSIAADSSPVYGYAAEAQREMEHVHVLDTGSMSGGAGLSVLYAAHLAQKDTGVEEMLSRLQRVKKRITARFILENTAFLLRGGRMKPFLSRWMDAFLVHPTINMKDDKMKFSVALSAQYRRNHIHRVLRGKRRIDTSLLFITHAGLSEPELRWVREETERLVHFDRVVTMATSSAVAVNVGPGTFGLMFHTLSDDRETGGRLFDFLPK